MYKCCCWVFNYDRGNRQKWAWNIKNKVREIYNPVKKSNFKGLYADERISKNRESFNKIIADALNREIDLIISESISGVIKNTLVKLNSLFIKKIFKFTGRTAKKAKKE